MKYKITKHLPAFCDVDKEKEIFVEKLDDIHKLEFVVKISKLEKFESFSLSENFLIVNFKNNTSYVLAHIEKTI